MYSIYVPQNLASLLPQDSHLATTLENRINEMFEDSLPICLTKKTFGTKRVHTVDLNIGRAYHRLVFEKVQLQEECAYFLRGIAVHHDYRKALGFTRLTSKIETIFLNTFRKINPKPILEERNGREIYYNHRWKEPTLDQETILNDPSFPLLIVGPPGSGKSFVVMGMLQEKVQEHLLEQKEGVLKLLYITSCDKLANLYLENWKQWINTTFGHESRRRIHMQVLTFEQLNRWQEEGEARQFWTKEEMLTYISKHLTSKKVDPNKVLEEFVLSSYALNQDFNNKKDYATSTYRLVGENHCLIEPSCREAVYNCYMHLVKDMKGATYPGLLLLLVSQDFYYDFSCVDEAQLASMQEILNVINMTKGRRVLISGDSNQKGEKAISTLTLLDSVLHQQLGLKVKRVALQQTHRLEPSVAKFCNELVLLNNHLYGGKVDKTSYSCMESADVTNLGSSLVWLEDPSEISALAQDAMAAGIVLRDEDIVAAKNYMQSSSVFSSQNILGLEFSQVFIFLSETILHAFENINKKMKAKEISAEMILRPLDHLPSQRNVSEQDASVFSLLSNLIISISRSQGKVYFYAENSSHFSHKLNLFLPWFQTRCLGVKSIEMVKSSQEDWLNTIHRFIDVGAIEQASDNLRIHFGLNASQVDNYIMFYKKGSRKSILEIKSGVNPLEESFKSEECSVGPISNRSNSSLSSTRLESSLNSKPSHSPLKTVSTVQVLPDIIQEAIDQLKQNQAVNFVNLAWKIMHSELTNKGKWLCEYQFGGETILERILDDKRTFINFSITFQQQQILDNFIKVIEPYFMICHSRKQLYTYFEAIVDAYITFKVGKAFVYSTIMQAPSGCLDLKFWDRDSTNKTVNSYCHLSHLLCGNQFAIDLLDESIFKKIIKHSSWKNGIVSGLLQGVKPLHYLCARSDGTEIFLKHINLFLHSPESLKGIFEIIPTEVVTTINSSPLYFLLLYEKRNDVIKILYNNLRLLNRISAKLLCAQIYSEKGEHMNASLLYSLSLDNRGCALLNKLLEMNPSIIKEITGELLSSTVDIKGDGSNKSSILYQLVRSEAGVRVLLRLVKENPKIVLQISGETLFQVRTENNTLLRTSSIAFSLTFMPHGMETLFLILQNNPNVVLDLTAEALYLNNAMRTTDQQKGSLFYNLICFDLSRKILLQCYEKNPALVERIPDNILSFKVQPEENSSESILVYLTCTKSGIAILSWIVDKNPKVLNYIVPQDCLMMMSVENKFKNRSIFAQLVADPKGLAILSSLVEIYPIIPELITAEFLLKSPLPTLSEDDNQEVGSISIGEHLEVTDQGRAFLEKLFATNTTLAKQYNDLKMPVEPSLLV